MASKRPALILLGFVVTGIAIANLTNVAPVELFAAAVCFLLVGLILLRKQRLAALFCFMTCLGLLSAFHFSLRYQHLSQHDLSHHVVDRPIVRIFGKVSDWPDIRPNRIELKIDVDSILKENRIIRTDGALLLKISDTSNVLQRGDRVDFRGRLYPLSTIRPSGRFDYGRYLNLGGVRGLVYLPTVLDIRLDRRNRFGLNNLVDKVRAFIVTSLNRNLEPTQAALARGFLIGETRNIPSNVYDMFRDSGTLHLLAVSGSNVSLVLLFILFVMRPFKIKRRRKSLYLLLVVLLFTQLAYGEPSVVRAAVMASLIILASLLERRYELNHIIASAALIILLFDPAQLFDVGFQLSFVTAWGLILTGPILTRYFGRHLRKWYGWILTLAVMSFAAQIFSTPIVAYHFERIPAISVLANLIIVPLVSAGVIGILILIVAHLILPTLGLLVGSLVNPLLKLVVSALFWLGGENMLVWKTGSLLTGPASPWMIFLIYLVLVYGVIAVYHRFVRRQAVIIGMISINILLATGLIKILMSENRSILINSIPGGVVVAIPSDQNDAVDLIISGCRSGSFSIGDRILTPWLDRHDITRVNRIFVIDADYDCFSDLFDFASTSGATRLYAASSLKSVLIDQYNRLKTKPDWDWELLGKVDAISDTEGFFLAPEGLVVKRPDYSILISHLAPDRLDLKGDRLTSVLSNLCLIFPGKWKTSPREWNRLDRLGLTPIVCSEIEQQHKTETDQTEISPDLILPEFLIDLRKQGPVKFDPSKRQFSRDL